MGENVRTCIPHCHRAASACPPLRAGAGASLERKRPATAVDGGTSAAAPEAKRSRNDGTLPPHSPAGVQQGLVYSHFAGLVGTSHVLVAAGKELRCKNWCPGRTRTTTICTGEGCDEKPFCSRCFRLHLRKVQGPS